MKFSKKTNSIEFYELYKKISKIYFKIFLEKKNSKIYWYGIASLPLIIFTTAFVFKMYKKQNYNLLELNNYEKKININFFNKNKLKKVIKNFLNTFKNFLFNKKKLIILYSSNKLIENYCLQKKILKIKFDPIIFISEKKITKYKIDTELNLFLTKFIENLNKVFFKSKKEKIFFKILIDKFFYFYKIYLIFINKTKFHHKSFISGYSSIFYIRLYLAALKYNNNSNVYNITHGNVEILQQKIDLIYDGISLADYYICQNKAFFKKIKIFLKENKKILFKPKLISLNTNYKINFNNKKNFKDHLIKNILIVGYPFSKISFSHYFNHINASTIYHTENELIRMLNNKYNVFYKAHPDSANYLRSKINIKNKNFITGEFEETFKNFDCLIFTYHKSTALGFSFLSDKPIFILKYKNLDFDKKTYFFFKKKVFFIDYDIKSKRLIINKNSLKKKFRVN